MGDGTENTDYDRKLVNIDDVLDAMREFNGDDTRFTNIATQNADFSGLVPSEFYNGISETTIDDGHLAELAVELNYMIEKFTKYLIDNGYINSEADIYTEDNHIELGEINADNVDALLAQVAASLGIPVEEFASIVAAFAATMNPELAGDLETEGTTNTGSKGGGNGSGYNGGNYYDPGNYEFYQNGENEEINEEFDDFELEDDEEITFEEETPEEETQEGTTGEETPTEQQQENQTVPQEENNSNPNNDPTTINGNKIIDEVKDENGNVVAVSVIGDGKKTWYQVVNGNVLVPKENATSFKLPQSVTISVDGADRTINSGNYPVDQVIYNADGSVRSVRLICDNVKVWAHLDSSGNVIKCDYITGQNGIASLTGSNFDKIDVYGNNVGKFSTGDHFISEVMYDSKGNAIAYKLTGDGVYEEWVYPNGNTTDGTFSLFDQVQTSETTSVETFNDNKGLYGLLGVLFVGLGATLVVRKKIKDKENASLGDEEETSESYEDSISTGNYGIYDVKKDDEGTITAARLNPVSSNDEYWVEV